MASFLEAAAPKVEWKEGESGWWWWVEVEKETAAVLVGKVDG